MASDRPCRSRARDSGTAACTLHCGLLTATHACAADCQASKVSVTFRVSVFRFPFSVFRFPRFRGSEVPRFRRSDFPLLTFRVRQSEGRSPECTACRIGIDRRSGFVDFLLLRRNFFFRSTHDTGTGQKHEM